MVDNLQIWFPLNSVCVGRKQPYSRCWRTCWHYSKCLFSPIVIIYARFTISFYAYCLVVCQLRYLHNVGTQFLLYQQMQYIATQSSNSLMFFLALIALYILFNLLKCFIPEKCGTLFFLTVLGRFFPLQPLYWEKLEYINSARLEGLN